MRILLTNDDGVHADGFAALRRIAAALSDDVWACAPETEHSGASRKLTLADPIRVRRLEPRVFACDGTPTDCVMLAMQELVEGAKPDLVLSGVNRGQNVAEDCSFSGTVAGALQGMTLGVRSIALSQGLLRFHDLAAVSWGTAEAHAPAVVHRLLGQPWPDGVVMNVNFPDRPAAEVTELEMTRQGVRPRVSMHAEKRSDPRGRDYYWMGFRAEGEEPEPGTDLHAMRHGRISATPLHVDMTHRAAVHDLRGHVSGPLPRVSAAEPA